MKPLVLGVAGMLLLSACSGVTVTLGSPSSDTPEVAASDPIQSPEPSADSPAPDATELLLGEGAWEALAPTLTVELAGEAGGGRSRLSSSDKVSPERCRPVARILSAPPDEAADGDVAYWGAQYFDIAGYEFGEPSEFVFVYDDEESAAEAVKVVAAVAKGCTSVTAGWGRTFSSVRLRSNPPRITWVEKRPTGTGFDLLTQAGNVLVLSKATFPEELAPAKAASIARQWHAQSVAAARGEEVPVVTSTPEAEGPTLDCAELTPIIGRRVRNYSEEYGAGSGQDMFVEVQIRVRNRCGKAITRVSFDVTISNEADDVLLLGHGTDKVSVPAGSTRTTSAGSGFTVHHTDEHWKGFTRAKLAELSATGRATGIVFQDGSSLP